MDAAATLDERPGPRTPWRRDATLIGLVGVAHGVSHFSQLLLAPLFPWLKDAFGVGYAELGFLMTIFFVVSCVTQAAAGFWVDRYGPRPVLLAGLALIGVSALGYATAPSYLVLALLSVTAGIGNGVFHPVDYTLLNRRIGKARLGHAYSVHGISGSLGWAAAPALLVPLTLAASWRVALLVAAAVVFAVLALLWWRRGDLDVAPLPPAAADADGVHGTFDFLRIPAVWMCFGFFFFYAGALSVVQSFATESARQLHAVPAAWAAMCLTLYMAAAAGGMVVGGFLASDPVRSERVVGAAFAVAATIALAIGFLPVPGSAVPLMFAGMGVAAGVAGPSRDLIVKRAAPDNATGRVYGVVYAGLDIGQAVVPIVVGRLMDLHQYRGVWLALALLQAVLIASAFGVRRARRTVHAPALA
jgi:FSR family fosmidomycin resistance protein-like MFS transporter